MKAIERWVTRAGVGAITAVAIHAMAADLDKATPESVGMSSARLERIGSVVQASIAKNEISGAVVGVTRNNKLVYLKSFGAADAETKTPMTDDSIFRIASMSKAITSVAVMMLYEDGKLLLWDPVSKYVPEFKEPKVLVPVTPGDPKTEYKTVPAKREITITDLLAHTSGISYQFWNKPQIAPLYNQGGVSDGLEPVAGNIGDNIKRLAKMPLIHHPGEGYEYGLNTDVLGYLVEVVSGMTLDQFLKERILTPLKMTETQFYISPAQRARMVNLYVPAEKGGMMKAADTTIRWGGLAFAVNANYGDMKGYYSGGAGLTSTAKDYLRFVQMLINGGQLDGVRLLSPKAVELMSTNQIGNHTVFEGFPYSAFGFWGDKFGLGFGVRTAAAQNELGSVGEYTWGGIYSTRFWIDPKEKLGIVVMAQRIPRDPEMEARVHSLVYQSLMK